MARLKLHRSRIFTTLLILIAAVAIVPLLVSSVVTVRSNREDMKDQVDRYLTRSALTIADRIGSRIQNYSAQVQKIGDAVRLAAQVTAEQDPFESLVQSGMIEQYHDQDPAFLAIRATDRSGRGSVLQPETLDEAAARALDEASKKATEGVVSASVTRGPFFRLKSPNDSVLMITAPVKGNRVEGETLGIVAALISLAPIAAELIDEGRRGQTAYVVDERGNVLLHSVPSMIDSHANLNEVGVVADFVANPGARLTRSYESPAAGEPRRVIGTLAPVEIGETVDDKGKPKKLFWGVVVEKDEKTAYALVTRSVERTVWTALAALLFAFAAAAFFARQLAQPISVLAEKSREIADGHFGEKVEVASSNEIGELAETFNEMSEKLEKQMTALKQAARENRDLFISSIRALAAAIDAKDPYTRGHSERVARYSLIIGRHLDLPRDEMENLRVSALLHDVGKIGIDDRILRKPSALTDEEFEIMKQHPAKGAAIMESIYNSSKFVAGMKYHHEKWEGGGYPEGLRSEDIPMQARIVAVADTFDAMTTTRPYQKAMELSYVISKIKSFANTRFDPAVVEALVRAWQKGDVGIDESSRSVA